MGQLPHFPGSVAPNLPGVFGGSHCPDVPRYMEWLRGWLWAQGMCKGLVLVGYTLGASIALQYALDYPEEVSGLVLSAVSVAPRGEPRPGILDNCLKAAAGDEEAYGRWQDFNRGNLTWVAPAMREHLLEKHRQTGPMSQYRMIRTLFGFDVHERIASLQPGLLLIRGADDPLDPSPVERDLHERIAGSGLVLLPRAGHFPATERPHEVNKMIEEFIVRLEAGGHLAGRQAEPG